MKHGTCHHDKLPALRRIEGQIRGIQKMIDEGRYCVDILNATGAALGALRTVEKKILKDHLEACVKSSFSGNSVKDKEEKMEEIFDLLEKVRR